METQVTGQSKAQASREFSKKLLNVSWQREARLSGSLTS